MFLFEWLEKLDEKECAHFFNNPFKSDQIMNTDSEPVTHSKSLNNNSQNLNATSTISNKEKKSANPLLSRKLKIDPFANPKMQPTNTRPIRNLNGNLYSNEKYYETDDKQALAVIKDYKSYLHLKNNFLNSTNLYAPKFNMNKPIDLEDVLFNKEISKEKLKKQIAINELTLARMKLDLYLF